MNRFFLDERARLKALFIMECMGELCIGCAAMRNGLVIARVSDQELVLDADGPIGDQHVTVVERRRVTPSKIVMEIAA